MYLTELPARGGREGVAELEAKGVICKDHSSITMIPKTYSVKRLEAKCKG